MTTELDGVSEEKCSLKEKVERGISSPTQKKNPQFGTRKFSSLTKNKSLSLSFLFTYTESESHYYS